MRKIIYFVAIACFFVACTNDRFYMEGRVETQNVTQVTSHSAMLNGRVELSTIGNDANPEIVSRGFVLRVAGVADHRILANSGGQQGNFRADANNLSPNTTYRVQAFARINYWFDTDSRDSTTTTFYGNVIEFTTRH